MTALLAVVQKLEVLEEKIDDIPVAVRESRFQDTGSLLDTILHFCYDKTLIRIKSDHSLYGPNREPG